MSEATAAGVPPRLTLGRRLAGLAIAAIAWVATYRHLTDLADVLVVEDHSVSPTFHRLPGTMNLPG